MPAAILMWLSAALDIVPKGVAAYEYVMAANAKAKAMVAEKRDPTAEEWAAVVRDMAAEHAKIQAAK